MVPTPLDVWNLYIQQNKPLYAEIDSLANGE